MKILVDADACPVKGIIVKVAKALDLRVLMFIDTSHYLNDGYSEVTMVDKGRDSVDIALVNKISTGDIVVTQDYGVAAMALAKGAYCISQNGLIYDNNNIDKLLFERHLSQKVRRGGGKTGRSNNPRKRTLDDDTRFEGSFRFLCTKKGKKEDS